MAVLDLICTTAPAALMTVEQAKAHLRVDGDDEDDVIEGLVASATGLLDGYDGRLGRAIVAQTWTLHLPAFPACRRIALPLPPLISVTSVKYLDADGVEQTIDPADYVVLTGPLNAIAWRTGFAAPTTTCNPRAVTITFVAGYGEPEAVPPAIVQAVKLLLGWSYCDREGESPEPAAVMRLLAGYRVPKI